ncbi:uncharacterized protein LOC134223041 [Armigeres subalbatus]|uniref:uncharacterized protein LOC134223041 n=1 Tax=Armigeres subalbatus TaxID=124917 RepID=UPI002ED21C71
MQLADPTFFESNGVDIVLGIEYFFDFFETGKRISLGEQLPTLNESVFGWVISGGISVPTSSLHISCNVSALDGLDTLIARFWSCEEVESGTAHSPEEKRCEEWFSSTVQRNTNNGRYTVALPMMKGAVSRLGESRNIAFRRLQGTERRLARDSSLREQYVGFMEEYLNLGHMEMVDEDSQILIRRCCLPHHPVVKEVSTTTKVHVVFDASCKTSSGVSLNGVLLGGPIVQEDLRSIMLRCRTKQIMLVLDEDKMFRQVIVRPEDRPIQCILWRKSPSESVPRATMEDTSVDDVITGANDVGTETQMHIQLNAMLSRGGFQLRKWASNCPAALLGIPEENLAIRTSDGINLDPDPSVKTLGLTWIPSSDILRFQFTIPPLDGDKVLTKRSVLSDGINHYLQRWVRRRFHEKLHLLNQAKVKRCVIIPEAVAVELHCFSDASEKAYGACLYVCMFGALMQTEGSRLELCGAVVAAQLYEKVRTSIKTTVSGYFWTDSTCDLRWLQASPTTWTTFVVNRTAKIQTITEGCRWMHVPETQNPADLISRGIPPQDILENQFWWRGPTWLEDSSDQ